MIRRISGSDSGDAIPIKTSSDMDDGSRSPDQHLGATKQWSRNRQKSCVGCKLRKAKCDRKEVCGTCATRGEPCVWKNATPCPAYDVTNLIDAQEEIGRLRKLVDVLMRRLDAVPQAYQASITSTQRDVDMKDDGVDPQAVEDAEALLSFANSPISPQGRLYPSPIHSASSMHMTPSTGSAKYERSPLPFSSHSLSHPTVPHPLPAFVHPAQPSLYSSVPPGASQTGPFGVPVLQVNIPRHPFAPQMYYDKPNSTPKSPEAADSHEARYDAAVAAMRMGMAVQQQIHGAKRPA